MRPLCLPLTLLLLACPVQGFAATSQVTTLWLNGGDFDPNAAISSLTTPLTDGDPNVPNDGAVIQIGYFNGVSLALDPGADYGAAEWASFTPLTGLGSVNPHIPTSIGDGGTYENGVNSFFAPGSDLDGFYSLGVTFDTAIDNGVPAGSVRIGVRFFDSTSAPNASTFYNTVTSGDDDWIMTTTSAVPPPTDAVAVASLDAGSQAGTLVWEDNSNAFITSIPEPSSTMLLLLALLPLSRRRR